MCFFALDYCQHFPWHVVKCGTQLFLGTFAYVLMNFFFLKTRHLTRSRCQCELALTWQSIAYQSCKRVDNYRPEPEDITPHRKKWFKTKQAQKSPKRSENVCGYSSIKYCLGVHFRSRDIRIRNAGAIWWKFCPKFWYRPKNAFWWEFFPQFG